MTKILFGCLILALVNFGTDLAVAQPTKIGSEFTIHEDQGGGGSSYCGRPAVAGLGHDGFVVTYYCFSLGAYDPSVIHGTVYNSSAQPVRDILNIGSANDGDFSTQTVVSANFGRFLVCWDQHTRTGLDILAKLFTGAGIATGPKFLVNTQTAGDQTEPSATALADGSYVVVWRSHLPGIEADTILGQHYSALTAKIGSEFRLNTNPVGPDQSGTIPRVTGLTKGSYVAIWANGGQVYTTNGLRVGTEFPLPASEAFAVAALGNGGFVVVTVQNRDITGQRYTRFGKRVGNPIPIAMRNPRVRGRSHPAAAAMPDGGFVVIWIENAATKHGIFGRRYSVAGEPLGSAFQVDTPGRQSALDIYSTALSALSSGGFIAVWDTQSIDTHYFIEGQRFSP